MIVCKFAKKGVCVLSVRYGISPQLHIECDGKEDDRSDCPFWNK